MNRNPFSIVPVLGPGTGFDPYVHVLVAKIRAGKYSSELWDWNAASFDYAERTGVNNCHGPHIAVKSRWVMTPEQRAAYRAQFDDPVEKAKRAEIRAARDAERKRFEEEWRERARLKREAEEREEREWREAEAKVAERRRQVGELQRIARAKPKDEVAREQPSPRFDSMAGFALQPPRIDPKEREAILAGYWECAECLRKAVIMPVLGGEYELTCPRCIRTVHAPHEALASLVARKAQQKPLNVD